MNPDHDPTDQELKPFYRAQREGRRARRRGAGYKEIPYARETEFDAYRGWQRGWLSTDKSLKKAGLA